MKAGKALGIIIFFFLLSAYRITEDDAAGRFIAAQAERLQKSYPQEKVYLNTDRPYYGKGDDLWFSAFLVGASSHRPAPLSRVAHVDLINPERKVICHRLISVDSTGRGFGDLKMADTLLAGEYTIRAYTSWMQNFDEELFFEKSFILFDSGLNETKTPELKKNDVAGLVQVNFFPEGGNLVKGLSNIVAFKVSDKKGFGIKASGIIRNEKGEKVADLSTFHDGTGAFALTPNKEKYTAELDLPGGLTKTAKLPQVDVKGIALSVKHQDEGISFRIQQNYKPEELGNELYMVVQSRNRLISMMKIPAGKPYAKGLISEELLPQGIIQLTIIDGKKRPQAERLVYWDKGERLKLSVNANQEVYGKRDRVKLSIKAENQNGEPVSTSLSLNVVDAQKLKSPEEFPENIRSYMLLSSDVKGLIRNPDFYFREKDSEKEAKALDYLLMTQGWRRFSWKDLLNEEYPELKYPIEKGMTLSGRMLKPNGRPLPGGTITMFIPSQKNIVLTETTDAQGRFLFSGFYATDTTMLVVQGMKAKGGKDVVFEFDKFASAPAGDGNTYVLYPKAEILSQFLEHKDKEEQFKKLYGDFIDDKLMDELVIRGERVTEHESREGFSKKDYNFADFSATGDDLAKAAPTGNVLEALQSRVSGVRVVPNGEGDYNIIVRGARSITSGTQPLCLVDDIPVSNVLSLSAIPVRDIEKIEVLKSVANTAVYGARGANGVIRVVTKRGSGVGGYDNTPPLGVEKFLADGFYAARVFYSPDYSEKSPNHLKPDLRATLYRQPIITTDKNGTAEVEFYTGDIFSFFKVVLEGMDFEGHFGATETIFEVKE